MLKQITANAQPIDYIILYYAKLASSPNARDFQAKTSRPRVSFYFIVIRTICQFDLMLKQYPCFHQVLIVLVSPQTYQNHIF